MRFRFLAGAICAFLMLLGSIFAADSPQVLVDITAVSNGTYVLTIKDGKASVAGIGGEGTFTVTAKEGTVNARPSVILQLTPGPAPTPTPEPTPAPVLTERAKAIKDATAVVVASDATQLKTATLLSAAYSEIGKQVTAGKLSGQAMIAMAVQMTQNMVLAQAGANAGKAWKPVTDLVSTQWTDQVQRAGSDAEFSKLLGEISSGIDAVAKPTLARWKAETLKTGAADHAAVVQSVEAIDWTQLLAFIMAIIEMIMKLSWVQSATNAIASVVSCVALAA